MSDQLGRLERVELRGVWATEDRHFTPWLAEEQNIEILGQTLNIELEVEGVEKNVGSYRADLICQDTEDSSLVLIENQFEKTDHKHLGQILTYTAGTGARTVVWIAERFADEHREALDWLNQHTSDDFQFFGLEVELWRIGDSPPAPKFNIVSKPNDWTRNIRQVTRRLSNVVLSDTRELYLRYWTEFAEYLDKYNLLAKGTTPRSSGWMAFAIGRAGFNLGALISKQKGRIGFELNINHEQAREFFDMLLMDKVSIEGILGAGIDWRRSAGNKASKVQIFNDMDPGNEETWPKQFEWHYEQLNSFRKAFEDRVSALDLVECQSKVESEE